MISFLVAGFLLSLRKRWVMVRRKKDVIQNA